MKMPVMVLYVFVFASCVAHPTFGQTEETAKGASSKEADKAQVHDELAAALERERLTNYIYRVALAHREWLAEDVGRARQLLEDCPADLRDWEWHYLRRLCNPEQIAYGGHTAKVTDVAFSSDGGRVASISRQQIKVWDPVTGKESLSIPATTAGSVAISPDGKQLATGELQTVTFWNSQDGQKQTSILAHELPVRGIAYSPDGKKLATSSAKSGAAGAGTKGEVKVWDVATGRELFHFGDLPYSANGLAFSPDGKYLAVGLGNPAILGPSRPGEVRVWDVENGTLQLTLKGHTFWVLDVAFSPDSKSLASASADQTVRVWEVPEGHERQTIRGHTGWVRTVDFSPDGKSIASAGDDQVVRVWNARSGDAIHTFRGHGHQIIAVAYSSDGKHLASAGGDSNKVGEVRIWNTEANEPVRTLQGTTALATSIGFSPDSKLLASASRSMSSATPGQAIIHRVDTCAKQLTLEGKSMGFSAVAFSPDGVSIATGGDEGVKLWNQATGDVTGLFQVFVHPIHGIAFSRDGRRLASVGADGVKIWERKTERILHHFRAHTIHDHDVAFSPDGRHFATTSWGGYYGRVKDGVDRTEKIEAEVKIWNAESGQEVIRMAGGGLGLAYSPDGKQLASGSQDRGATIWDAKTGKVICTLQGYARKVANVAYCPSGRRIATAGGDHTVKIWETKYGQEVLTLRDHGEPVTCVNFSPNGRYLASASSSYSQPGQVKIFDAGKDAIEP
jgi:WD40 repeat protein